MTVIFGVVGQMLSPRRTISKDHVRVGSRGGGVHVSVLRRRSSVARRAVDDVTRAPDDDRFDAMREDASRCTKLTVRYIIIELFPLH